MNQDVSKVRVNPPVSFLVRIGQSGFGDLCSEASVINLRLHCAQASFNVTKTFPVGKLSKSHAKKLIETGKLSCSKVSPIPIYAFLEFVFRKKVEDLRKNDPPRIHWLPLSPFSDGQKGQNTGRSAEVENDHFSLQSSRI